MPAHEEAPPPFLPPAPESIQDTGLDEGLISDLILKILYMQGQMVGQDIADHVALPFLNIVGKLLADLKQQTLVTITGGGTHGEQSMVYDLTKAGGERAREAMERTQYTGPAPVPISDYRNIVGRQSVSDVQVTSDDLDDAFEHLVLPQRVLDLLGPAINSGRSIFIYGAPGTGKTAVAESISDLLGSIIFVPYSIKVDGQIIQVYDEEFHDRVTPETWGHGDDDNVVGSGRTGYDRRWLPCRRPVVTVGGELTLEELDLVYDPVARSHQAPPQVKANGGMLLIDDFGRQQVRPVDLLNRWMVPLERGVDFLRLQTGRKIDVPFDELIVFSTNLDPRELVDEAFLRRIRHKIEMRSPSVKQFRSIMKRFCSDRGVEFDEEAFQYLISHWYEQTGREMRSVHPRDIIDQIIDIAQYRDIQPVMKPETIDRACESYFVKI